MQPDAMKMVSGLTTRSCWICVPGRPVDTPVQFMPSVVRSSVP
jgi:hypothetical protein